MKYESHKDIAYRFIKEYEQDPEAFEKKYSYRSDIDKIIKLLSNKTGQEQYIKFASSMDLVKENPNYVLKNMPDVFALVAPFMVDRINSIDLIGIIHKMPTKFNEWKAEIDSYFGKTKVRKIKELIDDYELLLMGDTYTKDPLLNTAFKEVRDELVEQQQYWKNELSQLELDEKPAEQQSLVEKNKQNIKNEFYYKGETDWEFAFSTEKDFLLFTDILASYFANEEYTLPENIIRLKRGCKTRLAKILNETHKNLTENKLRSDIRFLEIVRILSPYSDDKDLYSTLTK